MWGDVVKHKTNEDYKANLYSKSKGLVESFINSLIENDLDVIVATWLHFRLDRRSSPNEKLKELFTILFKSEMELEIMSGCMRIFNGAPQNMLIPIAELNETTRDYMSAMLKYNELFFEDVDGIGFRYWVYKKFIFNSLICDSGLWKAIVTKFVMFILKDNVNDKYLGSRAEEVLLGFIVDEISDSYRDYLVKSQGDGSAWRESNKRYIYNLGIIYTSTLEMMGLNGVYE